MRIFAGTSNPNIGIDIANYLNVPLGEMQIKTFSCGETYTRITETIRGQDCYVIQSIGVNPNNDYMELFLIMDALKRSSANSINVILPYFGYSRQDKKSAPREPISARLIADLLQSVQLNRLITIDLHADQIQGFFNIPVDHLTALPLFSKYFIEKNIKDLAVVAPDTGRAKFAKKLADKLHGDLVIMHKTRPEHNISEVVNIVGEVRGKTLLLVDDMIDTGGSVTSGLSKLREAGCNDDIYLAATHPVFSGFAYQRLKDANFKEIVVTDSIPKRFHMDNLTILSTAPLLGEAIKLTNEQKSIHNLINL
jgi:ribose-phosphate pyrophosphokinase